MGLDNRQSVSSTHSLRGGGLKEISRSLSMLVMVLLKCSVFIHNYNMLIFQHRRPIQALLYRQSVYQTLCGGSALKPANVLSFDCMCSPGKEVLAHRTEHWKVIMCAFAAN